MKKKNMTISVNMLDAYMHTRSAFATVKMTGAGAHKSKKDYDRKRLKHEDKKVFNDYR